MFARSSIASLGALGLSLFVPALALAQTAPPADAPPPPAPGVDPELVRRMEKRIADLEARAQVAEKKAEARKVEEDKKAAEEKKAAEATQPAVAAPFAFGDLSWAPGNKAPSESPLKWGPFTGELRVDTVYHYSFNQPKDNTISGSSEVFRHNEVQLTQLGIGGDFYYKGVQARLMTQFGMYSTTTPRNDASPGRGQWQLDNALRYISEAYGGYHFDVLNGINIQAGIFMSYVGLWSYYNFDNWTYQPSYVSSNTPWFFNGVRAQIFVSDRLKLEPWLVNGWQAYGKFNQAPGVGLQIKWAPNDAVMLVGNQYFGTDTLGVPGRKRLHTDDSVMVRYHNNPGGAFSKAAASLTIDAGCEFGDGVPENGVPAVDCKSQYFLGFMAYTRLWFAGDKLATTIGGGAITNPGRYLVLIPPINGATAYSGTPYFTANPKDPYKAWDMQVAADYMPREFVTFRLEFNHRAANVPYFSGPGGVTPPGGNQGTPGSLVPGWKPDLVKDENRLTVAMMVRL
ncbi:outer membrane protein [Minicystis rosea]|nr:outer membrane protein [Minicystis rosea]